MGGAGGGDFPDQLLFGETHLHTDLSLDSGAFGNVLGLDAAYRYARGDEVTASQGTKTQRAWPLDFLMVSDHSDNLGLWPAVVAGDPALLETCPPATRWNDIAENGTPEEKQALGLELIGLFASGMFPEECIYTTEDDQVFVDAWDATVAAAEAFNDPGTFTALIGYEWTSVPDGNNLHRNVMFRGDADVAPVVPFTTLPPGSLVPEALWAWMQDYEDTIGGPGSVTAFAHNGNMSNGLMFPEINPVTNMPITPEYAEARAKWERTYEVTQIKGDGEAHPFLSPNDEFADYETWDKGNLDLSVPKQTDMLQYEYGRSGLKLGLQLGQELGTNPYKHGFIGATDAHTSLANAEENDFFGKFPVDEPTPENANRWKHVAVGFGSEESELFTDGLDAAPDLNYLMWEEAASGYAAVWVRENTRAEIFDAFHRKETYATTGPRIAVRFFGGFDFEPSDAESNDLARIGYEKGVPMGGDLAPQSPAQAPTFLFSALKDPDTGNLDQFQIIKGWLDANGNLHEQVYPVAWSGDRQPNAEGMLPAVGNTVDLGNATWTNTIGAERLAGVWQDPDFDPSEPAFYYARVIEIPTPRWTAYDVVMYDVVMSEDVNMITQERAYSSAIWYTPAEGN